MRASSGVQKDGCMGRPRVVNVGACSAEGCDSPAYCRRMCKKHYNRANYLENHDARKAAARAWHANQPPPTEEQRERSRERTRKWQQANRQVARAYYRANKEQHRERRDRWAQANPERYRQIMLGVAHRRRARLHGSRAERFTHAEILDRDGWICQLCGEPIDPLVRGRQSLAASIDHIVPVALGGDHTRANVQAAHIGCNSAKGARLGACGGSPSLLVSPATPEVPGRNERQAA